MTDSIRLRIVENIVAGLNAATIAGGYQADIGPDGARQFRKGLQAIGERNFGLTVLPTSGAPESLTDLYVDDRMTVSIKIEVGQDPRGGVASALEVLDPYMTDVHRVLVSDDYYRGGLARQTEPIGWNLLDTDGGVAACEMFYGVVYRHQYDDLTQGTA